MAGPLGAVERSNRREAHSRRWYDYGCAWSGHWRSERQDFAGCRRSEEGRQVVRREERVFGQEGLGGLAMSCWAGAGLQPCKPTSRRVGIDRVVRAGQSGAEYYREVESSVVAGHFDIRR